MSLELNLNITQEQKLIMTQQMQQSLKVLQMSFIELLEYVEQEVQENPVLEAEELLKDKADFENSISYKELIKYLQFDSYGSRLIEQDESEEISPFNFISEEKSLNQFLKEQLLEFDLDVEIKLLCEYIIDNLDDKGFLDISLEDVASETGYRVESLKEALEIVQGLEPSGIGARNITECLLIQIAKKGLKDKNLVLAIQKFLQYVADNKYNLIAKELGITIDKAQEYGDIIKSLEPKPSRGFYSGEAVKYIQPDAYVRNENGSNYVIMNEDLLPKLNISSIYKQVIYNDGDKEVQEYVKEKINSAMQLIKSIESRKTTLQRVLERIIKLQQEYFNYGDEFLKPMTMSDIAVFLEMHESTISRTVKDKYLYTNRGMIKVKDLFTSGISSAESSDNVSSKSIKSTIKKLIDNENKGKPLSDQDICDCLNHDGINISRRTVAKYREEMGIKGSSKRKRF